MISCAIGVLGNASDQPNTCVLRSFDRSSWKNGTVDPLGYHGYTKERIGSIHTTGKAQSYQSKCSVARISSHTSARKQVMITNWNFTQSFLSLKSI